MSHVILYTENHREATCSYSREKKIEGFCARRLPHQSDGPKTGMELKKKIKRKHPILVHGKGWEGGNVSTGSLVSPGQGFGWQEGTQSPTRIPVPSKPGLAPAASPALGPP